MVSGEGVSRLSGYERTLLGSVMETVLTQNKFVVSVLERWDSLQSAFDTEVQRWNLNNCLNRLVNRVHQTFAELLEDIRDTVQGAAREIGEESSLGLALLTVGEELEQQLEKRHRGLLGEQHTEPMTNYEFLSEFARIIPYLPNSLEELDCMERASKLLPLGLAWVPQAFIECDMAHVKAEIDAIVAEWDLDNVCTIIRRYDGRYSRVAGVMQLDLAQLSAAAIIALRDYVDSPIRMAHLKRGPLPGVGQGRVPVRPPSPAVPESSVEELDGRGKSMGACWDDD
jgi:hypothetical protein